MTDLLLHRTCPSVGTLFKSIKKKNKIFWGEKNLNENRLSSHLKENKFNLVSLMSSFTWWAGSLLTRGVPCNSCFSFFTREPRKSKVQSSFPSTAMMHREEKHGQDQKGKKVRRRSSRGIVWTGWEITFGSSNVRDELIPSGYIVMRYLKCLSIVVCEKR